MKKKIFFLIIIFIFTNSIFAREYLEHAWWNTTSGKEVDEYYKTHSLLKSWDPDTNTWKDYTHTSLAPNTSEPDIYIISHGMNDNYNADWITESAVEIRKHNPNAIILSVNWDEFSGRADIKDSSGEVLKEQDKNFLGSTWINSVANLLAEKLKGLNIKSVMAHSYGTHLFASTFEIMQKKGDLRKEPMSFIALDPAEETLTFTGAKDNNPIAKNENTTHMWSSNKKSKNWNIPDNITTEVYKSSVFLGTEETQGDYNMLIAAPASVVPKAIGGDWENPLNFTDNHSRAASWLPKMLAKSLGSSEYKKQNLVGGWFNKQIDSVRGSSENKQTGWDGVVNSDTSVKSLNPELEYVVPKNVSIKSYADVFVAEAQSKLGSKSEWENTVLNPSAYSLFKLFHGNAKIGETACDTSLMAAMIKTSDDTIAVYDANDDQYYNYTISTGKIEKINASSENVLDDINEAINGNGASTTNENSIMGSIDSVTNDNADIENAINGVLNSKNNSSTKLDKIIEKGKELVNKYITLDNVKKVAQKALDKLLERYPAVNKIIQKLGDIIKYGKDLFKLVKGLLGGENFINLLKNCSMLKNLLAGGIQKIGELLKNLFGDLKSKFTNMLCKFVSNVINGILSKVSGFRLDPQQIKKWIENAIDKTLHKSTTWVSPRVDSFSLSDGNDESKNSNNSSSSGASILGGQQSVNAN